MAAAFNFNRTKMRDRGRFVFAESAHDIENGLPAMRGVVTARQGWGAWDLMVRVRWFGAYSNAQTALLRNIQDFAPEALVDVEAAWRVGERYRLKMGVENILDNYPDPAVYETCCGMVYRRDSVVPWQGVLYYLQLGVRFD